tara:strand:- start:743 stop:1408 length:666 start_codon:yes stop_codon:yes gene_type:complete
MEPISTALAGIALFKSAVDGIKGAISTANDVSDIAGFIDNLFEGEKQVQQKRNQKSGVTVGDQFGIKNVASEIIDAKLAKEQMYEISQMVDLRFGNGTWKSIVEERARRIQAAKEAAAEAKRKKIQEAREFEENLKQFFIIASAVVAAAVFFIIMMVMIARAETQFVECRLEEYEKVDKEWHCYYLGANKTRTSMVISEFCPRTYMCEYDPNSDNKITKFK